MEKRRLGKTGLEVSVISLGGIPLQKLPQEQATEVIEASLNAGVNFIDTARGYAASEVLIGEALQGRRDQVYIATKSTARDYEGMKSDIDISLSNLQTDYIDLYQLHLIRTMEQYEQVMGENGAYRALVEAKQAGKIGHIGITSHTIEVLEEVLDPDLFSTVQFPYNPVERQGEALFKKAKQDDIGIICMKPIAGGAFEKGELSLKWLLENEDITVLIPGMDTVELVKCNCAVAKPGQELTEVERTEIQAIVDELGTQFCRRCGYCLPCPQKIDIPSMFLFEGYVKRYNLPEWAKGRYENVENTASKCIKCGICEPKCPYDLPIMEMMERVAETFGR